MKKEIQHLGFVSNGLFLVEQDGEYFGPPFYLRLHEGLLRMFPQVTFYCVLAEKNDLTRRLECTHKFDLPHLHICPVPLKGGRLWRGLNQMIVYWRTLLKTDVICIDIPNEIGFFAALVCRLARRKYFVRVLGNWADNLRHDNQSNLLVRVKTLLAEGMERTTVNGAALALFQGQELFGKYPRLNDNMKSDRVHSTLSPDMFFARQDSAFHSPTRLITVSRLVPLKGLDTLLQAMRLLHEQQIEVELWCVGEGPARSSLEELAAELGLTERVRFLGHIPNGPPLSNLYQAADIFVLPSRTEGISQALLEALAHSLPTIASNVGGIPGVVTNNVHGLLVPPGSPLALAKAIQKLIEHPLLAIQFQQAGFARAQNFRADILRQTCREMIETTFGPIRKNTQQ